MRTESIYLLTCLYILSILVAINGKVDEKLGSSLLDKVLQNNSGGKKTLLIMLRFRKLLFFKQNRAWIIRFTNYKS